MIKKLLSAFAWVIAAVLMLCLIVGICSCNTVKKHKSVIETKKDSTTVKSTDVTITKVVDSSSSKKQINSDETVVNVEFVGDTNNTSDPVIIHTEPGTISISANGRNIKKITATRSKFSDSSTQTNVSQNEAVIDKTKDSTTTKTSNIETISDKKSSRFNWWWFLLIIPVAFYSYYKFKK